MKIFTRLVLSAIAVLASSSHAWAGRHTGVVDSLIAREDGLVYVTLVGNPIDRPECTNSQKYFMIKNETSEIGQTQIAMLLSAWAAEREVTVVGTNQCTRWHDGEDISYVFVKKRN